MQKTQDIKEKKTKKYASLSFKAKCKNQPQEISIIYHCLILARGLKCVGINEEDEDIETS